MDRRTEEHFLLLTKSYDANFIRIGDDLNNIQNRLTNQHNTLMRLQDEVNQMSKETNILTTKEYIILITTCCAFGYCAWSIINWML